MWGERERKRGSRRIKKNDSNVGRIEKKKKNCAPVFLNGFEFYFIFNQINNFKIFFFCFSGKFFDDDDDDDDDGGNRKSRRKLSKEKK